MPDNPDQPTTDSAPEPTPDQIGLIRDTPVAVSEAGIDAFELERARLEVERLSEENAALREDRNARKKYAKRIFIAFAVWLAADLYVVFAQGFGRGFHNYGRFHLTDTVLVAFLTTSTATVIGVFLVVVNYLFPKR